MLPGSADRWCCMTVAPLIARFCAVAGHCREHERTGARTSRPLTLRCSCASVLAVYFYDRSSFTLGGNSSNLPCAIPNEAATP